MENISELKFNESGLIPAIAQDYETKEVLMLAYMNAESLAKTLEGGKMCYYSRSRKQLWLKGETSGHFQTVVEAKYDCDLDSLLFLVKQEGAACHTGEHSCFYRSIPDSGKAQAGTAENVIAEKCEISADQAALARKEILYRLYEVIEGRRKNPVEGSYTNYLFEKGLDKILKKVGEETAEVIIAAKNQDKCELTYETSDLMYHLSVLMVNAGITWDDIFTELDKRSS